MLLWHVRSVRGDLHGAKLGPGLGNGHPQPTDFPSHEDKEGFVTWPRPKQIDVTFVRRPRKGKYKSATFSKTGLANPVLENVADLYFPLRGLLTNVTSICFGLGQVTNPSLSS